MSAEDLAVFLRAKMGQQRVTNTEMVRQTKISRRTWYRLLNADIEEAKLSTLIKLSNALNIGVTQLVHIYFNGQPLSAKSMEQMSVHTNLPSNSLVATGQQFIKTWEVRNDSKEHWLGLTLNCIDEALEDRFFDETAQYTYESSMLKPTHPYIQVADTKSGDIAKLSVNFISPNRACTTISHWRFHRDGNLLQDETFPELDCMVRVVKPKKQPH